MYESRAIHPLAFTGQAPSSEIPPILLQLWNAIDRHWQLTDPPHPYEARLRTFMDNRVNLNPLYKGYYDLAETVIADLLTQHGDPKAFEVLFQTPSGSSVPQSPIEAVKRFVSDEFVALRVALGGFLCFGAINYCGYVGGANIEGEPVPYRTMATP